MGEFSEDGFEEDFFPGLVDRSVGEDKAFESIHEGGVEGEGTECDMVLVLYDGVDFGEVGVMGLEDALGGGFSFGEELILLEELYGGVGYRFTVCSFYGVDEGLFFGSAQEEGEFADASEAVGDIVFPAGGEEVESAGLFAEGDGLVGGFWGELDGFGEGEFHVCGGGNFAVDFGFRVFFLEGGVEVLSE